jgi:hypothetical protein
MLPRDTGRYIRASSGLAGWTRGWSSETRSKASGRTAVWAGSNSDSIPMSIPTHSQYLGGEANATNRSPILLYGEPILADENPSAYRRPGPAQIANATAPTEKLRGDSACPRRSIMQADRHVQARSVVREPGRGERGRAEQSRGIV